MKFVRHKSIVRGSVALLLLVLAVGVSGCGVDKRKTQTGVSEGELADGAQPYFNAGPVTYQIQISRQLNPYDSEDVQYLAGVPGAQSLGPQQFWFGVFLWAKNQTGRPQSTAGTFKLVDSAGQVFTPTVLSPGLNPYAWRAQSLAPDAVEPLADSTASQGSTGGGLILFKLTQNVYSNRPLTLEIYAPGHTRPSTASLDL